MANDRLYVIINNVSSLDIEGLYIEELPPISKPTTRSLREEIDGRDGDIVTKLGYSAYDKEMKIGLAQNYDINEVISFFNSKGKIQFSNELDKYYNFEILDQIDFESLQTFKSAVVTFHCQPFKYPVEETPIEGQLTPIEVEGNRFHITNTSNSAIEVEIIGNTYQEANPTINDPKEIYEGYQSDICVLNKNLASLNNQLVFQNHKILPNGLPSPDNDYDVYLIPIIPNANYTLSITNTGNTEKSVSGSFDDFNGNVLSRFYYLVAGNETLVQTISSGNNAQSILLSLPKTYDSVQLEYGTSQTSYVESEMQIYYLDLNEYEYTYAGHLNKIGNYYDCLFKNVLSSPYYNAGLVLNAWYIRKIINKTIVPSGSTGISINDMIPESAILSKYGGTATGTYVSYSGQTLPGEDTILYISTEPTYIRLADPELYDYLVENIHSFLGETNIFSQGVLPVNFKAKVGLNNNIEVIVNNLGNIYSKPKLDIVGYGSISVSLNNNQIFSVNVEDEVVIDSTNLEAYNPNTNQLMNRQVVGNIDNLKLEPGENTLRFSGNVTSVTITDYTRYL